MKYPRSIRGWLRAALLALLAIAGLIALAIAFVLTHPDGLKTAAASLSERFLERTLVIDGSLTLDLSLSPKITARDLRFGNAAWSDESVMLSAGYLMVQIDLPGLLKNRVHLLDLNVRDAELLLEDPVAGRPNWSFRDGPQDGASAWTLVVEGLQVERSVVRARIGELSPMNIEIPALGVTTDSGGNLALDGSGRLNGDPWRVQGNVGPFDELLSAGRIDLDLDLSLDEIALETTGSIGNLASLTGLDLILRMTGSRADVFGSILQMPEAFVGDVTLNAAIRPDGDQHTVEVIGHVARFEIDARGTVADLTRADGLDADLQIRGPDAAVFARVLQIQGLPGGPFEIRGSVSRDGGDLELRDVQLTTANASGTLSADFPEFPQWRGARAKVSLTGTDLAQYREFLRLSQLPSGLPFSVDLALENAEREMLTVSLVAGSHRLSAVGELGGYPDFQGTRLETNVSGSQFAELTSLAGLPDTLTGAYEARSTIVLESRGVRFTDTRARLEPFAFEGEITVPDWQQPASLAVDGQLAVSDLSRAGRLAGVDRLPARPVTASGKLSSDGASWRLDGGHIELDGLSLSADGPLGTLTSPAGIALDVKMTGSDIEVLFDSALPDSVRIPFTLTGQVTGTSDSVGIRHMVLRAEGGELILDGRVALAKDRVGSQLAVSGHGANLARLIPSFRVYTPPQKSWQIEGDLSVPSAWHVALHSGSLNVGTVVADITGVLDLENREQTDLTLSVSGESLTELGQIGSYSLPEIPFSLKAELDGTPDIIRIHGLEASWGESDLTGQGSLDLTGKPSFVLEGSSSILQVSDIQEAVFGEIESSPAETATRLIPDTPIPLDILERSDWEVDVQIGRFEGRSITLRDAELKMAIEGGVLTLDRLQYRDDIGFFHAKGRLQHSVDHPDSADLVLAVTGEDAKLGLFMGSALPPDNAPTYNIDISIRGTGATVAELAADLDGSLLLSSDGGQINNTQLQTFAGDFLVNVLETLNPFTRSEPFTTVECMVLNAGIDDGRIRFEPGFVMRTDRLNMFVVGDVNLQNERLNLSLATQARHGIGISAATLTNPFFRVGGTLASPALQLDAQNAAIAASVTAATAGLNIVVRGMWSRLRGEQNPCPGFLDYRRKPEP